MIDTLSHTANIIHDTVYIKGADALDILNKTDEFYNNAWSKLEWFIGIFAALIGGIIPIGLTFYREYQYRLNEAQLKAEFKEELLKLQEQITKEISAATVEMVRDSNDRIDSEIRNDMLSLTNTIDGKISYNEAQSAIRQENFVTAFRQTLIAMKSFVSTKEDTQIALNMERLIKHFLDECNKHQIDIRKIYTETARASKLNPLDVVSDFQKKYDVFNDLRLLCESLKAQMTKEAE